MVAHKLEVEFTTKQDKRMGSILLPESCFEGTYTVQLIVITDGGSLSEIDQIIRRFVGQSFSKFDEHAPSAQIITDYRITYFLGITGTVVGYLD